MPIHVCAYVCAGHVFSQWSQAVLRIHVNRIYRGNVHLSHQSSVTFEINEHFQTFRGRKWEVSDHVDL